jgi:hypothetical protein
MRFESHLGHSLSAGQRPFFVSDRVDAVNSVSGDRCQVSVAPYVVCAWPFLVAGCFLSGWGEGFVLAQSFIAGTVPGYMTWLDWGSGSASAWCQLSHDRS